MEKKQSFFAKDGILAAVPVISAVLWIVYVITTIIFNTKYEGWLRSDGCYLFELLVIVVIMFSIKRSYKNHTKNVMKGLIGAALISIIFINAENIYYHLAYMPEYHEAYGIWFTLSSILDTIVFAAMLAFTHNHFAINANHHSSPARIKFNQTLSIIIIIASVGGFIFCVIDYFANPTEYLVYDIVNNVLYYAFFICVFLMVVCIETKLDYFREVRETVVEKITE